jgi:hypothetical protein
MSLATSFGRLALAVTFVGVALAANAAVSVKQSSTDPSATPFPSDRFTERDWHNNTFRRVNLPKPDCAVPANAVECGDIDVINQLDGFSTQPRITVPFTGAIDPTSVSSDTLYLINLGDTLTLRGFGERVGINRALWDPATNTLVAQPDELLAQHSRYLLVVTDGIRDSEGQRIVAARFLDDLARGQHEYDRDLRDSMRWGTHRNRVVSASLFTTQSITGELQKINRQVKQAAAPAPLNFAIGNGGAARAVFALGDVGSITFNRQTSVAGAPSPVVLPLGALAIAGPTVGTVAYATYRSPNYLAPGQFIPVTSTLTGAPAPQGQADIVVQMFLPAGPKPAGGWPVAIYGHGFTDTSYGTTITLPSVYASQGLATLSINVVGHGFGPNGTLAVALKNGSTVTVPAGGRGFDQNGDGAIGNTEGSSADGLRSSIGSRDALRQTTIDLMQLIRQIEAGIDVDGDGSIDLSQQRIYYSGQSFGGIYGTILMGIEPHIGAGVLNVPGGSITEIARLSPAFRPLTALALQPRGLLNLPPAAPPAFPLQFNENIPLRDEPVRVNNVPGAMAIQRTLDRFQWVTQAGNPVSYAGHIRKQPLSGGPKPVLVQFAKGDQTVPNPTSSALIRAGGLQDRAVFFRNDLAFAANGATPKNPHTFLTNIGSGGLAPTIAVGAQTQIAVFFASNGATVIDPDAAGPLFEVPIAGPLPATLSYIP